MACYHPLKRFKLPWKTVTGKDDGIVTSYDVVSVYVIDRDHILRLGKDVSFPGAITEYEEIPCGQCIGCRLEYSRQWANRMMLEAQYHEHVCFLTLTYDDDHLPERGKAFVDQYGVIDKYSSLNKKDVQKFIKDLRNQHRKDEDFHVRYFCAGEYGSENFRPHYHLVIFGYDFPDKVLKSRSPLRYPYYESDEVNDLWNKGIHKVTDVSWEVFAYVGRYVTKKAKGKLKEVYDELDIIPEFSLVSNKPGIGRYFYDDHKIGIYEDQEIILSTPKGKKVFRPPRYFDKLFDIEYPSDFANIKEDRRARAEIVKNQRSNLTSLEYLDQLAVNERYKIAQTKILQERSCT